MNLLIQSHGFSLTEALSEHARKRFSTALRHGRRALVQAVVRLRDVNGPRRGGVDKRCAVELRFARGRPVVLDETDSNLYIAIDRAAGRSKQAMLARLDRAQSRRRARRLQPSP